MPPPAPDTPDPLGARQRDADLVQLLAQGQARQAFDGLVTRYATKVFHLCLSLLNNEAEAQDAAQDALLRTWRALPGYRAEQAALSTWLYTITRNHCLSLLQQRRPAPLSTSLPEVQALAEAVAAPDDDRPGADSLAWLRRQVQALPPPQRHCVLLYYYDERSVAEVAALLALPEGSVKTHLHRARATLLTALQSAGLRAADLWP